MSTTAVAEDLVNPDLYQGIAADKRAYQIGDTVTVYIAESAAAESSAFTDRERDLDFNGSAYDSVSDHQVGIGFDSQSRGAAVTSRRGALKGQLTARVIGYSDVGHLIVKGEQVIVINGEAQSLFIFGTLRPEDISRDNTIYSTRLMDAHIELVGDGVVGGAQRAGAITWVLRWLGLN
ncbi:flagellar basal body L-ring protein FlgH [Microbulbifer sp. ALW1]|uniref:flagellar basal body L-ring protein FlgH n=1 Tax=Microbulbifer sp. (strain ALW1) TaxID=1516059 RepID=UPI001356D5D9|nr:flagellar basal body L-ring protein FlgH [Microbulbifer sp. ALW1]